MSDVITRLKLESAEFDTKIKRATQGLLQMEQECHSIGGTLAVLEKDQLDYVKALGQMETVSKNVKGKLNELTAAYTELSVQYKRLTDEEKQGDYGKALSASLDQLRGRIKETQGQLKSVNSELGNTSTQGKNTGNAIGDLTSMLGLNIGTIVKFSGVAGAGAAALGVMKDAFFASEQNIDAWNSMLRQGEAAYEGFLNALNTGDISGYLSRINEIMAAAAEAYKELDRLSTQRAINNSETKGLKTEEGRYRAILKTGRYIAPIDGRAASMADGTKLTEEQLKRVARGLEGIQQRISGYIKADVAQANKAIEAMYKEHAARLGMSKKEFMAGTANMAEFDKRMEGYNKWLEFENNNRVTTSGSSQFGGMISTSTGAKNPYEKYRSWGIFKDDGELYGAINDRINERAGWENEYYSQVGANQRAMNRVENRTGRSGASGGAAGYSPKTKALEFGDPWSSGIEAVDTGWSSLTEEEKMRNAQLAALQGVQASSLTFTPLSEEWKNGENYKEMKKEERKEKRKALLDEISKGFGDLGNKIGGLAGGLSDITGGLDYLGISLPKGFEKVVGTLQAISSILTGISSLIAVGNTLGLFSTGGIVRAAGGMVVPGNFGYDAVPALLTSGEVVLNRAQQGNLASQLQSQSRAAGAGQPFVSGETLYLAMSNYLRASGKGELAFTGR